MMDLGKFQGLTKRIPQLTLHCPIYMTTKDNQLIRQPTISSEDSPIGTHIQADVTLFNNTYIQGLTPDFNLIYVPSRYPFGFHTRSKRRQVSLLKHIVGVFRSSSSTYDAIYMDECGDILDQLTS